MQTEQPLDNLEPRRARPGQRLKLLREAAGLSVVNVAEATRITRSRLEALERDDYESAGPAPAYVIGYFRAYARLLNYSVEPWLSELEQQLRAEADTQDLQTSVEPVLVDSHHHYRVLPWAALLVAAVIVWLVGGQFYGDQREFLHKVISPELVELNELADKDEVAKAIVNPVVKPLETPQASGIRQTPEIKVIPEASEVGMAAPTQVINVGVAGNGDALVVDASDDCWIEVQDRSGKQLIAQLLRSGNNLRLFGVAPFVIKLGNARAVSIWINSREIPVQPENDRRTLRLVAGP